MIYFISFKVNFIKQFICSYDMYYKDRNNTYLFYNVNMFIQEMGNCINGAFATYLMVWGKQFNGDGKLLIKNI